MVLLLNVLLYMDMTLRSHERYLRRHTAAGPTAARAVAKTSLAARVQRLDGVWGPPARVEPSTQTDTEIEGDAGSRRDVGGCKVAAERAVEAANPTDVYVERMIVAHIGRALHP